MWKFFVMVYWYVNLDLRNVYLEDIIRYVCYSLIVCCEKKNVDVLLFCVLF